MVMRPVMVGDNQVNIQFLRTLRGHKRADTVINGDNYTVTMSMRTLNCFDSKAVTIFNMVRQKKVYLCTKW